MKSSSYALLKADKPQKNLLIFERRLQYLSWKIVLAVTEVQMLPDLIDVAGTYVIKGIYLSSPADIQLRVFSATAKYCIIRRIQLIP